MYFLTSGQQQPASVCEYSRSSLIGVFTASLLLIFTLTIIIITQCLLMARMRKSIHRKETYTEAMNPKRMQSDIPETYKEAMNPNGMQSDIPVRPNEAYAEGDALQKMAVACKESTYEMIN